jgi:hypothetical protein
LGTKKAHGPSTVVFELILIARLDAEENSRIQRRCVKEYGEWLASNVSDETLKAAFREASDVTLSDGLDLEHIYKDQNPEFFVGKGIKPGIAGRFVENIRDWVENVKKAVPVLDMV